MDIRAKIASGHNKKIASQIADSVGNKPDRFKKLINLFFSDSYRQVQRSAWAVNLCVEKNPGLITPYLAKTITKVADPDAPVAVKRNILRMLQYVPVPSKHRNRLIDQCFGILSKKNETVAVRVFAMTVLANQIEKYPDLAGELKIMLEDQMPYGTPGFQSRARKIIRRLERVTL